MTPSGEPSKEAVQAVALLRRRVRGVQDPKAIDEAVARLLDSFAAQARLKEIIATVKAVREGFDVQGEELEKLFIIQSARIAEQAAGKGP